MKCQEIIHWNSERKRRVFWRFHARTPFVNRTRSRDHGVWANLCDPYTHCDNDKRVNINVTHSEMKSLLLLHHVNIPIETQYNPLFPPIAVAVYVPCEQTFTLINRLTELWQYNQHLT